MRPSIGLPTCALILALVLGLGPAGCAKKEKPAPAAPAAKATPLPPPLAQQKEPAFKEEPKAKEDPAKQEQEDKPPTPTKAPIRGGSVVRRVDQADVMYILKNLDIATKSFQGDRNRYPNSREELEPYYEKNAKINEALKNGDLVYRWKAQRAEEPDKTVLAYEGQPDTLGIRVVLLANGEIKTVNAVEFKEMPKVPVKK